MNNIRNFVIIAHVDHGKSTLADRMLEITGTVEKRQMKPQFLDQLELERERGITIKMAPVRMFYTLDDKRYTLNLIDTPGHSDFAYEVSRALAAVEGAVLLVDATQGIQAQTLANFEKAKESGLKIIGAVNKIDIASLEQIEETSKALSDLLEVSKDNILLVSGKSGMGVERLLKKIIQEVPPPIQTDANSHPSQALVFDSFYDEHKGVIVHVRVFNGSFFKNSRVKFIATNVVFDIKELGYFTPRLTASNELSSGSIGYIATGLKTADAIRIGDTLTLASCDYISKALPGYREPKPVVFASIYPADSSRYDELKRALERLKLTDASLTFEQDYSEVLGRGFKVGFLGRLHFEIISERIRKDFNIETVNSFPSVAYRVRMDRRHNWVIITNPKNFPDHYEEAEEPVAKIEILTKPEYVGAVLGLRKIFRFSNISSDTLGSNIVVRADLPMSDLIHNLDDKLKSVSEGFASLSYELNGYQKSDVVKMEILVAGHVVPGLTRVLPRQDVEREGRSTVKKLKDLLPRRQFVQAVQAVSGGRIIARENIPALRKDVTGHLYGGDRTRKVKLWKKQKKGKQRLKELANQTMVKIPPHIFKELLKK